MSAKTEERGRTGWFPRIMMVLLALLWTIPSLGLLISSFRPRIALEQSGWWTAFFMPFGKEWTLDNYRGALLAEDMAGSFINSIVVAIPATVRSSTLAMKYSPGRPPGIGPGSENSEPKRDP